MSLQVTCPYCRYTKRISREKIPPGVKWATCPQCRQRFSLFGEPSPRVSTQDPARPGAEETGEQGAGPRRQGAPWERRTELGLWSAIGRTFKEVLFSPHRFFRSLTFRGGFSEPLAFGLLAGALGGMFSLFWRTLLVSGGVAAFLPGGFGVLSAAVLLFLFLVVVPFLVVAGTFLYAVLLHLMLLLLRGGHHGLEATFRVIAYSQATQVWGLVPFLGGGIAGVWQLIVQIVGLREIHETTYVRVILAFVIPVAALAALAVAILIPLLYLVLREPLNRIWS
ncbi:MAG: YIP1 family protein [Deltaproteobacteria bacterium]|nr:YIP1 family protein [Deltaproteobacteria bacterium]MBW1922323.1 YIP1 family protein [Deltaproteobacteria bacterium]MBW1948075.1 YIP1 family protein [Deltaproteobacteria bacterium]MBW2006500.1 YIP1 family protein [Deltaproteobacteria bacterium]MBW2101881.1 YIP1 family protein [Deltaproteobacteria bacterium]